MPAPPAQPEAPTTPWGPRSPGLIALALVTASLGLHVVLGGLVELSPQEAYYWQYARHPSLSYFDHPPLAAWTIRLTTALFGVGERAVRTAAALHAAIFFAFAFRAARRLFGGRAALLAVVGMLLAPVFALGQTVITPDAPLLAGWAAALYFTVRALDEERGGWLLAAGAAVGFATLGKYTGWLLPPQILAVLLLDERGRRLLRTPWPWLGVVVAVALFSPVLVWNSRFGWVSFGYQVGWRASTASAASARRFFSFLGLQAVEVTPVLFVAVVGAALVAARRWRDHAWRTCALFSLPLLAVCVAAAPFTWVKGNWPAAAYPTAFMAAAALAREGGAGRRALARGALALAAALTLYLHAAMVVPALPFPARLDVTTGWRALAERVEAERRRLPAPGFVLGCTYKPASALAFYLPGRPETFAQNAMREEGLQYDFWFEPGALDGREGIVVLDDRDWKNCLRRAEYCQPLEELPPLTVRRGEAVVTTFRLWRCRYAPQAR